MSPIVSVLAFSGLLLMQIADMSLAEEVCDVWYLREPFSAIDCNPYSRDGSGINLQCEVQAPAYLGSRLKILWFFTNTSGETVLINMTTLSSFDDIESSSQTTENEKMQLTSTITFGPFTDPIHAGRYFCRVALDENLALFSPSGAQVIDTETSQVLSRHPCNNQEIYSQKVMSCAGNISSSIMSGVTSESSTPMEEPALAASTSGPFPSSSPQTISDANLGNTLGGTTASQSQAGRPGLSLWVYVLVGVAAVFGMIIIVLTILCIGLCLKKNKTIDSFKHKTPELKEFGTGSMMINGLYQHKEGDFTSGTHQSSHSQIADYNTLGERDYEIVDVNECKRDYNHLHRPSPPVVPGGRNGTFVFSPSKEFHSMSTLTSQQGLKGGSKGANNSSRGAGSRQGAAVQHGMMSPVAGPGMFPPKSASVEPEGHVYRELEQQAQAANSSRLPSTSNSGMAATLPSIYHSPTGSAPPDSARSFNKEFHPEGINCIDEGNVNEMDFAPQPPFNAVQPAGLQNKPETGNMFMEPVNPTAFPVHNYERVIGEAEYETPIVTRKAKPATPTSAPPPIPGRSSQTSMRNRSDSAARYETDHAQNFGENNGHYHKLVRNSGDHSSNSRVTSRQEFSEDNVTDVTSVMDDEGMPMDGTLTMDSTLTGRERNLTAFENPMSNSARGSYQEEKSRFLGPSIYDPRSSSSATGSLSSYIDQLQADEEDIEEPISDVLFEEIVASLGAVPERTTVSLSREGERPIEMQNGMWKDRHGCVSPTAGSAYSRLSTDRGNTPADDRQPQPIHSLPPKMCRGDIQNNGGVGYGLADCTRLKTVV